MKTRNGKIARLPRDLREQLNRRLDEGEPGKRLVVWLNALPEAQAVLAAEFGGRPVSEQNLSEWKGGGYRDWQRSQERRDVVRQLTAEAEELAGTTGEVTVSAALSTVLLAELALTARELLAETSDPETRWERLQEVMRRLAQLRREESNASRARVTRERWEQELQQAEAKRCARGALLPLQSLLLQEAYLGMFSHAQPALQAAAPELAGTLWLTDSLNAAGPPGRGPTESK
jgi:hypothetical protein